eukprot:1159527-Pelagomonas_calceolata.AAC.2
MVKTSQPKFELTLQRAPKPLHAVYKPNTLFLQKDKYPGTPRETAKKTSISFLPATSRRSLQRRSGPAPLAPPQPPSGPPPTRGHTALGQVGPADTPHIWHTQQWALSMHPHYACTQCARIPNSWKDRLAACLAHPAVGTVHASALRLRRTCTYPQISWMQRLD